jgi:hypothetical protein
MSFPPPAPPYLGPAKHISAGHNKPIHRIVIHSTDSPCVAGGARANAQWFNNPESKGSAHYIVDPEEVVQSVLDDAIAWHAPPNQHSIGVEMCDRPSKESLDHWMASPGEHPSGSKNPLRWLERNHRATLVKAARLTAELALAYDVPVRFLGVKQLLAGEHGITTHANVSNAFHQSTHWDPGIWPRRVFMRQVRKEVNALRLAAASPASVPVER